MFQRIFTTLALTAAISFSPTAGAQPRAPEPGRAPPVASSGASSNAKHIDFTSKVNGRAYRLFVSIPDRPVPPDGFPVIYLIDGNLHFGITVDTARIQSRWAGIKDPVIVGIGYQTDDVLLALTVRNLDLTQPVTDAYLQSGFMAAMPAQPAASFGGVDAYLRMIELEVKPRIAEQVKVNLSDQTLMGHSLGGLTTLQSLFTRPGEYRTYVAISPSIWWGHELVLANEPAFTAAVKAGKVSARVLLSVGANEALGGSTTAEMGVPQTSIDAMAVETAMVDHVRQLGARLAALCGPTFTAQTVVFADENHNSMPPVGIARGVRFAMRR